MIYEEIAKNITDARESGHRATMHDFGGVELFSGWDEGSFNEKIKFYEDTGEPKKAKAIEIIRDYCMSEKKFKKIT